MTVQSQTSRADYTGNGATTLFAVPFYFLLDTDLQVIRTDDSTTPATVTILTLGADYTVAGVANPAGGSVTTTVAPTGTQRLSILRNVPYTQLKHYVPNDPFPAASHEMALDKLTMEVQQLAEQNGRALTLPPNTTGVTTELPPPVSNNLLGWNPTATALQNFDPQTLATIVAYGTANSNLFSGDGVETEFTLTANPGSLNNLDVAIGGVTQRPGVDYNWDGGTTLTFAVAPPSGTNNILARYMQGLPIGTADANSVQFLQAGSGAVPRSSQSKMRDFWHVRDFGAVLDGVTDDASAFNAALTARAAAGGGEVWFDGNARVSSTVSIPARVTLRGVGGSDLNDGSSEIIGDLAVTPIVQGSGGAGSESVSVRDCVISRAAGAVPAGSVGLLLTSTDHAIVENVMSVRSAKGIRVAGQLGIHLVRCCTTQVTDCDIELENVVEVHVIDHRYGRNGGQDVAHNEYVRITGTVPDTINLIGGVGANSNGAVTRLLRFSGYSSNPNGIFRIIGGHYEGGLIAGVSSAAPLDLDRMQITGSTISLASPASPLLDVPAATLNELNITGCPSLYGTLTLDQQTYFNVSGNFIAGPVAINQGSGAFTGNTCGSTLAVTGVCNGVTVSSNALPGGSVITNTASGNVSVFGNTTNNSTNSNAVTNAMAGRWMKLADGVGFGVKRMVGTLSGAGAATVPHGLTNGQLKGITVQAFYKGASGEMKPMTVGSVDGANVDITGGTASAKYRVVLWHSPDDDTNW